MIVKFLKTSLCFYLFLLVSGCATLPEYARPRMLPADKETASPSEGFTYRQLEMADFRALSLPEDLGDHEKHIQAHSCIQIRPTKDAKFKVVSNNYHGKTFYYASIQHIAFDEDTSMIFNPKQQRWWLNKVKKAMREDQAK